MSRIVAILAVRMGSKRLYGKPLQKIEGKTIVGHLIDILKCIPEIESVILATSDKKENQVFVEFSEKNNLFCYVDKGYDEEDVLGRLVRASETVKADIVIRATSEEPIKYNNISEVIQHHIKTGADLTYTRLLPSGTSVEVISYNAMKKAYEMDDKYHSPLVSLCMFEHPKEFKIEKLTPPKELQRPDINLDVDTEENLFALKEIFKNVKRDKNGFINVRDALDFLEKQPHLVKMLVSGRKSEMRIWE